MLANMFDIRLAGLLANTLAVLEFKHVREGWSSARLIYQGYIKA